jgi:hypothetical protein
MTEVLDDLARRLAESPGDLRLLDEFQRQARRHGLSEQEQLVVEIEWARTSYEAAMLGEHLRESVPIMSAAYRLGLVDEGEYQNYDLALSRLKEFEMQWAQEEEEDAREDEARKAVKGFVKYLNKLVDTGKYGEALEGAEFFRHAAELESDDEASVYYVIIGSRSRKLREALKRRDKWFLHDLEKLEDKAYDWLERKTDSHDNEPLMQPPDMESRGKLVVFPLTMTLATWDPPRWTPDRRAGREEVKDDKTLRRAIIRLAHGNPELRPDLLPLLRKEAASDDERYLEDVGKYFQRKYGLTYEVGENAYGTGPKVVIWDEGDEPLYAASLTVDIDEGELNISIHQGRSGKSTGFYDVPPLNKTIAAAEKYARKHSDLLPK